jgi:hypothetical protein
VERRLGRVASLGIESHSGWAVVVAIGGSRSRPEVLLRGRLELAEPNDGRAKQPFHAAEDLPFPRAQALISSFQKDARNRARAEMKRIAAELSASGAAPVSCAILAASTGEVPPLASILASHALIHAAEGDHFRDAVGEAAGRAGLSVTRIRRKELSDRASESLGLPAKELERRVAEMRKSIGPPWGADQKIAALAAWSLLP